MRSLGFISTVPLHPTIKTRASRKKGFHTRLDALIISFIEPKTFYLLRLIICKSTLRLTLARFSRMTSNPALLVASFSFKLYPSSVWLNTLIDIFLMYKLLWPRGCGSYLVCPALSHEFKAIFGSRSPDDVCADGCTNLNCGGTDGTRGL